MGGVFSPQRWALALEMIIIGMLLVFSVLAILWAVLAIFKMVFYKDPAKASKPVEKKTEQSAPIVEVQPVASAMSDNELIAVLTAAIAAYEAQNDPGMVQNGFRVVSFRRANGGRAWNSK